MTQLQIEYGFDCPYCGEPITMLLELSARSQSYVEDCEVCCSPIRLEFVVERGEVVEFEARPA